MLSTDTKESPEFVVSGNGKVVATLTVELVFKKVNAVVPTSTTSAKAVRTNCSFLLTVPSRTEQNFPGNKLSGEFASDVLVRTHLVEISPTTVTS